MTTSPATGNGFVDEYDLNGNLVSGLRRRAR